MSPLKEKSLFNLEAAKVLINDHDNYAPSVHCSYYGCFQYMKWKLNSLGITYDILDKEMAKARDEKISLTSHNQIIGHITRKIEEKTNPIYRSTLQNKIKLLKTFRVESDYHDKAVDFKRSTAALELSKEIIALISKKI